VQRGLRELRRESAARKAAMKAGDATEGARGTFDGLFPVKEPEPQASPASSDTTETESETPSDCRVGLGLVEEDDPFHVKDLKDPLPAQPRAPPSTVPTASRNAAQSAGTASAGTASTGTASTGGTGLFAGLLAAMSWSTAASVKEATLSAAPRRGIKSSKDGTIKTTVLDGLTTNSSPSGSSTRRRSHLCKSKAGGHAGGYAGGHTGGPTGERSNGGRHSSPNLLAMGLLDTRQAPGGLAVPIARGLEPMKGGGEWTPPQSGEGGKPEGVPCTPRSDCGTQASSLPGKTRSLAIAVVFNDQKLEPGSSIRLTLAHCHENGLKVSYGEHAKVVTADHLERRFKLKTDSGAIRIMRAEHENLLVEEEAMPRTKYAASHRRSPMHA